MASSTRTPPRAARQWITRPAPEADPRNTTRHRSLGLVIALVGMGLVAISAIASWAVSPDLGTDPDAVSTLAWTFATSVTGFGLAKVGIAVTLVGIVVRLWHRANAVTAILPSLRAGDQAVPEALGRIRSDQGAATATEKAPAPLFIHRMAQTLWIPMLVMGAMALGIGLIVGFVNAAADVGSESFFEASAWTQGLLFLGEGLLLSGISFLLGTILASLRQAGGETQESLGLPVHTLKMPASAKAFIVLMATGMMMAIAQFVLYIVAASKAAEPTSFAAWSAWLGPFRETALGLLLAGIVLALFAISKVLAFQFGRLTQIIRPTA